MAQEKPLVIRPDDPLDVGKAPMFDGTNVIWADRPTLGIVIRQELGAMAGDVGVTPAPGRWYNDTGYSITLTQLRSSVGTAPLGADLICVIRLNGVDNTTLTITAGTYTSSVAAGPIVVASGGYVDVTVTQVGSTAPGADLTVSARAAW